MQVLVLIAALTTVAYGFIGRDQASGAYGTLMCNNVPAAGVTIKLYDDDRGLDLDDLMGRTTTNINGYFQVAGYTDEITTIDPKINIYTDCNDGVRPCQRKISIMIPDQYITPGKVARAFFNLGTIQLAGKFPGETRDCIH